MQRANNNLQEIKGGTNDLLKNYIEECRNGNKRSINKASKQLKKYILNIINQAVNELYTNDKMLFVECMNELTFCGRLAIYLQKNLLDFKDYYVDIEYYRLKVPLNEASDKRKNRIRCDILLHSRRHFEDRVDNLLAIEVKLANNIDDGEKDRCRLQDFVLPETPETPDDAIHSTLIGLFLRLDKEGFSQALFSPLGYTKVTDISIVNHNLRES